MTTYFLNAFKVNFDKSMNSLSVLTKMFFFLFRCNTECIYCKPFVQEAICYTGAMCKLYKIIYVPQLFHEHKYNSKKEILLATFTCINIAQAIFFFKFLYF